MTKAKPYINRLQDENEALKAQLREAQQRLEELQVYYTSPKFHQEDYAYVSTDVLPRLNEVRHMLMQ